MAALRQLRVGVVTILGLAGLLLSGPIGSQVQRLDEPAPLAEPGPYRAHLLHVRQLLQQEDPMRAWLELRLVHPEPTPPDLLCSFGEVHLMLGRATVALRYSGAAVQSAPDLVDAHALHIRALLRARRFEEARGHAEAMLPVHGPSDHGAALWAAYGSAMFRLQQIEAAADAYQQVVRRTGSNAEAHLRLGSGLLAPAPPLTSPELERAVSDLEQGRLPQAISRLQQIVSSRPDLSTGHRLLGEALYLKAMGTSMAATSSEFQELERALPRPDVSHLPIADFMPQYAGLSPQRRLVADRALALFGRQLPRLVTMGGRHDLLLPLEQTTAAEARRSLAGKRTFDGRYWDDVRGIGGLRAATGIEALDETAQHGFDTLSHEIAHQAHLYGFRAVERRRIRQMYEKAKEENRWLDFYAASNETEYFAQGVEAFVSYGKRPGREVTHGHTRFELWRVDPALHEFIASVVDLDPLRDGAGRERLLQAAFAVALRTGRPEDAKVAADWMEQGPARDLCLEIAEQALSAATVY